MADDPPVMTDDQILAAAKVITAARNAVIAAPGIKAIKDMLAADWYQDALTQMQAVYALNTMDTDLHYALVSLNRVAVKYR